MSWTRNFGRRGHRFVRYGDDCNIYVKTRKAGNRVKENLTHFIEGKLKLKVNQEKTAVDRPWRCQLLGLSFTPNRKSKIRIARESLKRVKQKIRKLTSRSWSIPMERRVKRINQYLVGWCGYFSLADTPSVFNDLDQWYGGGSVCVCGKDVETA